MPTIEERLKVIEELAKIEPELITTPLELLKRQIAASEKKFYDRLGDIVLSNHNFKKELSEAQILAEQSRIKTDEAFERVAKAQESLAKAQESMTKTFELYLKSKMTNGKD